jgi:SOS response regulatory protein OraA/RecX
MLKNVISSKSKILGKSKAYSNKDKLFRHAASKGFEINLISKILNGI